MASRNKYASLATKQCSVCGFKANLKGFASHERACRKRLEKEKTSDAFAQKLLTEEGYSQTCLESMKANIK